MPLKLTQCEVQRQKKKFESKCGCGAKPGGLCHIMRFGVGRLAQANKFHQMGPLELVLILLEFRIGQVVRK